MSSSSGFSEFPAQKGRVSEKPSFSQTCSLLSHYLKEKGSLGGLSLAMSRNIEGNGTLPLPRPTPTTTMDLFPISDKLAEKSPESEVAPERPNLNSAVVPLQETQFDAASSGSNKCMTMEPESAPMTIFYGGQVIVFNDLPADKAEEIMLFACQGSSRKQATTSFGSSLGNPVGKSSEAGTALSRSPSVPRFDESVLHEGIRGPSRSKLCDLPLSRKASLHRFLDKRKDRINAKAPYQTSTSKAAGSPSWLGFATQ